MIPPHGTRARYQRSCRCVPCRAANTRYQVALRLLVRHGRTPLGVTVAAAETWRHVRALTADGITRRDIAIALGLARPRLDWPTGPGAKMRLRTVLRVRRLWRQWCDDAAEVGTAGTGATADAWSAGSDGPPSSRRGRSSSASSAVSLSGTS
jgi:hypothetical protein